MSTPQAWKQRGPQYESEAPERGRGQENKNTMRIKQYFPDPRKSIFPANSSLQGVLILFKNNIRHDPSVCECNQHLDSKIELLLIKTLKTRTGQNKTD